MASNDNMPLLYFYLRQGLFNQVSQLCASTIARLGNDPLLSFWSAVCEGMAGDREEAIRQLERISGKRDVALPAAVALIK
jgi:hypothetical protein